MRKAVSLVGVLLLGSLLWASEDEQSAQAQRYFDGKLKQGDVVELADGTTGVVLPAVEADKLRELNRQASLLQVISAANRAERKTQEAGLEKTNKTNKRIATAGYYSAVLGPSVLNLLNLALGTSWLPWVGIGLMVVGLMAAYLAEQAARQNEENFRFDQSLETELLDRRIQNLESSATN